MLLWAYGTPDTWQLLRLNTCRVESVRLSPIRQNRKWQEARKMPRMCQKSLVGPQKSQQRFPRGVALRCGQSFAKAPRGAAVQSSRSCSHRCAASIWAQTVPAMLQEGTSRGGVGCSSWLGSGARLPAALSACRSTTVPHDSLTDRRRGCWPFSRLRGVGFFATKYRATRYLFRSLGYLSRRSTYGTPTTGPGSTGPRP